MGMAIVCVLGNFLTLKGQFLIIYRQPIEENSVGLKR